MTVNESTREQGLIERAQAIESSTSDIMVKVDDVSMVFNMASEQLNSLKEYAIALGKRELRFKEFRALDSVSFEVAKGDVFGILGTNGSGKSTLLKIIAGVLDPTTGSLEVNGQIAPLIELGAGFDMDLTARENIYLNGALLGYSKKLIDENFDDIVEFAEIENFLDIPIKNYSSGMIARIAFSIATVIVPEILLVDEVLSVGDFMFQKKCENRIRQLIDEYGVTVLIVSHSNDQIRRLCNKAIWIDKGVTRLLGDSDLVCGAYTALGGRTGSQEAKTFLFDCIVNSRHQSERPNLLRSIEGNAFKISVDLSKETSERKGSTPATVILASSASHVNAIYANSLARALDAPILPMNTDNISLEILQYLFEIRPKRIIYIDCGMSGMRALAKLQDLPFEAEVIDLSGTGDPVEYSLQIFSFGLDHDLWVDKSIVLLDYRDEMQGLSLAPFLYAKSCPTLIINALEDQADVNDALASIRTHGFTNIIAMGDVLHDTSVNINSDGFNVQMIDAQGSLSEICNRIYDLHNDPLRPYQGDSLCITFASFSQWMNYIGIGRYAWETSSFLISLDPRDLDSIVHCLNFTDEHHEALSSAVIIEGSENLEILYKTLIDRTIAGADPE